MYMQEVRCEKMIADSELQTDYIGTNIGVHCVLITLFYCIQHMKCTRQINTVACLHSNARCSTFFDAVSLYELHMILY